MSKRLEELLPPEILQKSSFLGTEYAWHLKDFEEAVEAARAMNFLVFGGQAQFRLDNWIYEMYWLEYGAEFSYLTGETWDNGVDRCAAEVIEQFREICAETDFLQEAKEWKIVWDKIDGQGLDLYEHLYFVIYMSTNQR